MAKVVSIRIDEQMEEFIGNQLDQGTYGSADEVTDAGLRLLQREAELAAVEAAIIEGEKSGKPRPFDFDAFIQSKRARHGRQ
ncbi:type II toxin-antitoxin system ParD family antitoxin [Rhizobium sp. CBN3]|uniref:type II toxin-antitoxin system ParD family antitoxin n=1 Tax=Rhizobium sp. CBN3 TaxID=3058045 RepID=UPI0026713956|nr:type II toxin-antitoxin system ParD family antitoxin [Rhizobium sp. CBN3]MDO3432791.1 type II toxin-antitoxin system ParD family antitoxin [Rhizobium sp. CBN3]